MIAGIAPIGVVTVVSIVIVVVIVVVVIIVIVVAIVVIVIIVVVDAAIVVAIVVVVIIVIIVVIIVIVDVARVESSRSCDLGPFAHLWSDAWTYHICIERWCSMCKIVVPIGLDVDGLPAVEAGMTPAVYTLTSAIVAPVRSRASSVCGCGPRRVPHHEGLPPQAGHNATAGSALDIVTFVIAIVVVAIVVVASVVVVIIVAVLVVVVIIVAAVVVAGVVTVFVVAVIIVAAIVVAGVVTVTVVFAMSPESDGCPPLGFQSAGDVVSPDVAPPS